jgi:hypothetical protein
MDVCATEHEIQVLDAMAASGIPPYMTCTSVVTPRSVETTERFCLPSNFGLITDGKCVVLEPVFSRGIYRPLPAGARVIDVSAKAVSVGASVPFSAGTATLTPVLKADPYSSSFAPATDIKLKSTKIDAATSTVVVSDVSFSLVRGSLLTLEGTTVQRSKEEFLPLYGDNTKAPCYLASAAYVALMFNGDAGRALPSDLVLQLDVTYETPRTADAFEPAVV